MHREYIDKIIKSSDNRKMEELEDVLISTIDYLMTHDKKIYEQVECDLYEIAEGKKLSEEKAIEWVESMRPKSRWTLQEVEKITNRFPTTLPLIPAYVIMNMLFSDFGDVLGEEMTDENLERYLRAAEDWYFDEDASKTEDEKLYCYWKSIVK